MSHKWLAMALAVSVTTTLLNAVIFVGQLSTPASARTTGTQISKFLDDDDFVAGVAKIVRKTVRDYCTVGKKNGIEC
jgi:hypothetical protein